MKLLKNEMEYRIWMSEDFLGAKSLSPEDQERELLRQMPEKFPCIASVVKAQDDAHTETVKFISPEQIAQWSTEMGKTKR